MDVIKSVLNTITGGDNAGHPSDVTSQDKIRHQLCNVDELQNGQMKEFEIKSSLVNATVLLIKQDNAFHAYSSKCCHYKLPLIKGLPAERSATESFISFAQVFS